MDSHDRDSADCGPGDSTRERLVMAGLKIFGECGFDGTSTRAIATEADANLAAIPYHFGGKQGLYHAVAEYVAQRIGDFLLPVVEEAEQSLADLRDRAEAADLLHKLVRRFAEMIIFNPETELWAALIQREQAHPTDAFEILYGGCMKRMSMSVDRLVAHLTGKPEPDLETTLLATTIIGQITVFRTSRAAVLRRLGWKNYEDKNSATIIDRLLLNVDACIGIAPGSAG